MEKEIFPKHYLYRRIVRAKVFIDEHFTKDISIQDLAQISCFSPYYFIRLFKDLYGITPRQYIVLKKMQAAEGLLSQGKPVKDVCFLIGYESLQTFSTQFKKIKGVSPSKFKKAMQRKLAKENPSFIPNCFLQQSHYFIR